MACAVPPRDQRGDIAVRGEGDDIMTIKYLHAHRKMKPQLVDWILGILIPLAVVVTALLYLGARGPSVEVRDVTIHEIPTPPHSNGSI